MHVQLLMSIMMNLFLILFLLLQGAYLQRPNTYFSQIWNTCEVGGNRHIMTLLPNGTQANGSP